MTVPTSHLSLLVTGGSGSGKSFVVGMLVEQLAHLRYSVLVLDREGDHLGLGSRRGIVVLGGLPDPPPVEEVMAVLDHRFGSVVLDLSQLPVPEQDAYVARLLPHVLELRRACGSPHWLVFDEAHALAGPVELVEIPFPLPGGGSVFATYRPQDLPAAIREGLDAVIWLPGAGEGAPEAVRAVVDGFGVGDPAAAGPDLERGSAVLLDAHGAEPQVFELGERAVPHIRHWHRYTDSELSPEHAFYFGEAGREGIARNVREFHRGLRRIDVRTLRGHAHRSDLSRWIAEILQVRELAALVAGLEADLVREERAEHDVRAELLALIEEHYLEV